MLWRGEMMCGMIWGGEVWYDLESKGCGGCGERGVAESGMRRDVMWGGEVWYYVE